MSFLPQNSFFKMQISTCVASEPQMQEKTIFLKFWQIFLSSFSMGPLVRSWCMRFEAKHHEFKRLAAHLGNYTNLPYSLAKRHQEGFCYRLQTTEGSLSSFIVKGIETGPGNKNEYLV